MGSADLESLLEYAGSHFRLRNYAEATRRGYLADQLVFLRFLKAQYGVSRASDVERRHVVDFLAQAKRSGASGATIARKLSSLRSFFLYLEEDGRIANSPVRGIPPRANAAHTASTGRSTLLSESSM